MGEHSNISYWQPCTPNVTSNYATISDTYLCVRAVHVCTLLECMCSVREQATICVQH